MMMLTDGYIDQLESERIHLTPAPPRLPIIFTWEKKSFSPGVVIVIIYGLTINKSITMIVDSHDHLLINDLHIINTIRYNHLLINNLSNDHLLINNLHIINNF